MSDQEIQPEPRFNPQPDPPKVAEERAPRPVKLRVPAIAFFVLGVLILVAGIAKFLPGGVGTGAAFAFWGILLFAFSFIPLPQTTGAEEPPLSGLQKVAGIFYEPSRVFKNLRAHPYWLAAFLVIGLQRGLHHGLRAAADFGTHRGLHDGSSKVDCRRRTHGEGETMPCNRQAADTTGADGGEKAFSASSCLPVSSPVLFAGSARVWRTHYFWQAFASSFTAGCR